MPLTSVVINGVLRFLDAKSLWKLQYLNRASYTIVTAHEEEIARAALVRLAKEGHVWVAELMPVTRV